MAVGYSLFFSHSCLHWEFMHLWGTNINVLYLAVRTRGFPRERREARRKRESFLRFCIQFLFFRSGFSLFFSFSILFLILNMCIYFLCVGITELILLQRRTGMTSRPHQCSLSKTLAKPSSLVLRELRLALFSFIFLWVFIIIVWLILCCVWLTRNCGIRNQVKICIWGFCCFHFCFVVRFHCS